MVWTCSSNRGSANTAPGVEMEPSTTSERGRTTANLSGGCILTNEGDMCVPEEDTGDHERWKLGTKDT